MISISCVVLSVWCGAVSLVRVLARAHALPRCCRRRFVALSSALEAAAPVRGLLARAVPATCGGGGGCGARVCRARALATFAAACAARETLPPWA